LLASCSKESFTSSHNALLTPSADTLHFDTVFTATGSTTHSLKIGNNNKDGIHISSVRLAGGAASPFHINVDGLPGPQVSNVDVAGNDSIYLFVSVSVDPAANNLPFIIRDSIEIDYNGNKRFIQLDAFGQNAHFLRNHLVAANETWNNDLPYVILGSLAVAENTTLTINQGCRIYLHADAPFIVNGTLNVLGDKYDSTRVVFAGDRLDDPYRNFPASYPGLIFGDNSKNNSISYGIIKNAYQAIVMTNPSASGPKLTLNETIIDNAYDAGILSINSSIQARNLLVSNCGRNLVLDGGNYQFTHCTLVSLSNSYILHKYPVVNLANYFLQSGVRIDLPLNALFRNSIIWGDEGGIVTDEVVNAIQGAATCNVTFDHVLWRVQQTPAGVQASNVFNQNPQFENTNSLLRAFSFRLKDNSPALDKGISTPVTVDLDGNPRPNGPPDLGAYEKQ
jgi:hypothetical protein